MSKKITTEYTANRLEVIEAVKEFLRQKCTELKEMEEFELILQTGNGDIKAKVKFEREE